MPPACRLDAKLREAMQQSPEIDGPEQSRRPARYVGGGLLLISVGLGLGIAAERLIIAPKAEPQAASRPDAGQAFGPAFSRVGDRIVVPEGSPLRTRLAVAAIEMTQVSHKLVLPAMWRPIRHVPSRC
jgi:hypothetical protein